MPEEGENERMTKDFSVQNKLIAKYFVKVVRFISTLFLDIVAE